MPLVRIDLSAERDNAQAIADGVHQALVDSIGIPATDRFQILTRHPAAELIADPSYLGVQRQDVVFVQISLVGGRPTDLKVALYRRIAEVLAPLGVRGDDLFVTLTENGLADWSVGNGEAQLLGLGTVPGLPT